MGKGLEVVTQEIKHMLCPGFNALGFKPCQTYVPCLTKYNKVT